MDGRCLHHKFALKANKFQARLDEPHEHVTDLKAESETGSRYQKKKEFKTKSLVHLNSRGEAGEAGKSPAPSFLFCELRDPQAGPAPPIALARAGHSQRLGATAGQLRDPRNSFGNKVRYSSIGSDFVSIKC